MSKKNKKLDKSRQDAFFELSRYHRRQLRHGAHFIFGFIGWNASGVLKRRPCSKDENDFLILGDCERPETNEEWVRHHILHGMLMQFPNEDVAWYTREFVPGNHKDTINALESEFAEIIKHLKELNN